jgi:hypothetical protein
LSFREVQLRAKAHIFKQTLVPVAFRVVLGAILFPVAPGNGGAYAAERPLPRPACTYENNPITDVGWLGRSAQAVIKSQNPLLAQALSRDEWKLIESHPVDSLTYRHAEELGKAWTGAFCSNIPDDGPTNAIRHSISAAFATFALGPQIAHSFLSAHEMQKRVSRANLMDLNNNALGINFGMSMSRAVKSCLPVAEMALERFDTTGKFANYNEIIMAHPGLDAVCDELIAEIRDTFRSRAYRILQRDKGPCDQLADQDYPLFMKSKAPRTPRESR